MRKNVWNSFTCPQDLIHNKNLFAGGKWSWCPAGCVFCRYLLALKQCLIILGVWWTLLLRLGEFESGTILVAQMEACWQIWNIEHTNLMESLWAMYQSSDVPYPCLYSLALPPNFCCKKKLLCAVFENFSNNKKNSWRTINFDTCNPS